MKCLYNLENLSIKISNDKGELEDLLLELIFSFHNPRLGYNI